VPKAAPTSRWSSTWLVAGLGAVAAVALIVAIVVNVRAGRNGTEPRHSPSAAPLVSIPPPPAVAPSPHAIPNDGQLPNTMTYLEPSDTGTLVKRIDLRTGSISQLFEAPGSQVALPATGDRAAYVVSTPAPGPAAPTGSPTPTLPIVHVVDLRTGEDVSVGEGSGPVWSADGTHLAAIRQTPQGPEIVAMTTSDPQLRPITTWATEWTILGWAGDRVLLFGLPLRMYLASMDGGLQQLPTPSAEIHGPSPDGRWVFAVSQGDAVFLRLGQSEPVVIDLGPWQLGNAHWTDNDLVVAAAATGTQVDAPSTVLVLDPAAGSMLKVSHTQGVVAALPSSDGRSFVMTRGKYPPTWKLWACYYDGRCRRSGDVKIGVALEQLG
jgi:hypothetical protein